MSFEKVTSFLKQMKMITGILDKIRSDMREIFQEVYTWFDVPDDLVHYSPANGGWNIRQILEHISLTNHFLLILIDKGVNGSLKKSLTSDYVAQSGNYDFDWKKLQMIGTHRSFGWHRPDHMEPTGNISLPDIKNKIQMQYDQCMSYLDRLDKGQGVLHKTMMTVNDLGRIDVYHYIYFLAQHAKRHNAQMKQILGEFVFAN
jgi:hypothetical protein